MALVLFSFKAKQSWLVIMLRIFSSPILCICPAVVFSFSVNIISRLTIHFPLDTIARTCSVEERSVSQSPRFTLNYLLLYLDGLATLHSQ